MTGAATSLLAVAALIVASWVSAVLVSRAPEHLRVENYRGKRVAPVLGLALMLGIWVAELASYALDHPGRSPGSSMWYAARFGAAVLLFVGFLDDFHGDTHRGFREHLETLVRLKPSTGVVKLVVGGGLAVWLAVLLGGGVLRVVASAVLIALATNLANGLDVRPGRALKWCLPLLALAWLGLAGQPLGILMAAAVGAGLGVLPFDLREAGMLGDAGSNPLGFLTGVGLAAVLPAWGVVAAAAAALALQVAAETVTISRLIAAVPPLRWFDALGRRSDVQA